MKNYLKETVFGTVIVIIFGGLLIWVLGKEPRNMLAIGIATLILVIGIGKIIWQTVKKKNEDQTGVPPEDEFTKLAKVYAGNQAFHYSLWLWVFIFVFNSSFAKNETMLGIGILGSALIYGVSLWYFKITGELNEK